MLWIIITILLILWLIGFVFKVAGKLIHILFIAALIMLIVQLLS